LTTKRRHAIPHIAVKDISKIDWKRLKASGYKGCVFDKDNTLTSPYAMSFHPSVKDSIRDCMETFDGKVVLLSNSAGLLQYDPKGKEASAIEKTLGIPVLRHKRKKPAGEPTVLESHFKAKTEELVMVGDRTFTDIAYGNLMGMLTVKCEPFTSKGENFFVKMARLLEAALVKVLRAAGCSSPAQKLIQRDALKLVEFVK
jgi:phosphatidylglycerophosphatase GEP4